MRHPPVMSKSSLTNPHKLPCPIWWCIWLALTFVCLSAVKLQHTSALNYYPTSIVRLIFNQEPSGLHGCTQQGLEAFDQEAASVLEKYFPQSQLCGDGRWRKQYAQLHYEIVSAQRPPRYLTSVAVQTGLGDRITGGSSYTIKSGFCFGVYMHICLDAQPKTAAAGFMNSISAGPACFEGVWLGAAC